MKLKPRLILFISLGLLIGASFYAQGIPPSPPSSSTSPGGANGSVQCNSSGSFGACSNITDIAPIPASYLDTDSTMAANSDSKVATQKAVKTALSSLTPDAATAAGPLCKDEAGQVVNCGNLEDVAYPQTATSLIEEAANLQAADFNGLKPFAWTGGNLTLPTAAANMYRPFGIGFPSGTYDLVPASYLDVISYNGTAITAGYTLACSGVGLYSIMGTGANAWQVFGPASGCAKGSTPFLADLDLSTSSLSFTGEEAKSVTITNNGDRATTPTTSLTTGTHFSITADTCDGQSIAPEGTCQVEVTSDGTGSYEDTLNIAYNDYPDHAAADSPLQVACSGTSGACTASYDSELATAANATDDAGGSETDATTGWAASSTPPVFDSIDTAPHSGTYHLSVTADSSLDGVSRAISGLSASTLYKISMYVRHNGTASANGEWRCYLAGSANADSLLTPLLTTENNAYVEYSKYFYFNARQDTIYCAERNAANDGGVYIDSYSIKAVTTPCLGSELFVDSNAASLTNEANSVGNWQTDGTSTFESSNTSPGDGTYVLHMTANANGGRFYYDLSTILTEGKKYFLSLKAKSAAGDAFLCNFSSSTNLTFSFDTNERFEFLASDSSYVHAGMSFVYDDNHRYFGCQEYGANDNSELYFDSLSIKEITSDAL